MDKFVHFVFDIVIGWNPADFKDRELPPDDILIELSRDNLSDVVHDWVSDGDFVNEELGIWIESDPRLRWQHFNDMPAENTQRILAEGAIEALRTQHQDHITLHELTNPKFPYATVELGDIISVDPQENGKIAMNTEAGDCFVIDSLAFEMLFAAYTEGKAFTVKEWEQWAEER